MGSQLESDSKLQFYPTHQLETFRIMGIIASYISTKNKTTKVFDEKSNRYRDYLIKKDMDIPFSNFRYSQLLNEQEFDLIKENINLSMNRNLIIADLFAGEGEWLKLFKQLQNDNEVILIGNELETNRFNKLMEDDLIDYKYNLAFEDLQLPKKTVNIMCFNPPYGTTNGERNTRRYLRMILERDIMTNNGVFISVIKETDVLDCLDLYCKYFNIEKSIVYKTHDEEFDKFGQIVIIASLRDVPLNLNSINDAAKFETYKQQFKVIIESKIEFHEDFLTKFRHYNYTKVDLKKAFDDFELIKSNKKLISNKNDRGWKWVIDETKARDLSEEIITVPNDLKSGELANIIASGKINGEINLGGIGRHVAVGGVKRIIEESKITVQNKKGELENKTQTIIQSLPYLNLLVNDNGKLKIKELKAGNIERSNE